MPSITMLTRTEEQILRENGMDPKNYGVMYRDASCIRLLCFLTRDIVTIDKGDRPW